MPAADALRLHPRAQAHRGEFHVVLAVNVHEAVSGHAEMLFVRAWAVVSGRCIGRVWCVWACSVTSLLCVACLSVMPFWYKIKLKG